MFLNRRMFWNVRPTPASTMSLGRALRKMPSRARRFWYQTGRMIDSSSEPIRSEQDADPGDRQRAGRSGCPAATPSATARRPRTTAGIDPDERLVADAARAGRSSAGRGSRRVAVGRVDDAQEDVEERGLAGAVRAR